MRLGDLDAIVVALRLAAKQIATGESDWLTGYCSGLDAASNAVDEAPTIDAVPVVRCKDCKYSRPLNRNDAFEGKFVEGCVWCMEHGDGVFEDDFCSDGVRVEWKDGEG